MNNEIILRLRKKDELFFPPSILKGCQHYRHEFSKSYIHDHLALTIEIVLENLLVTMRMFVYKLICFSNPINSLILV